MSMIAQEYAEETKKLLKRNSNGVDWNFAFVIYIYDEDNDTNLVEIDSVWTNETEALQRMMNLEKMENAILERMDSMFNRPLSFLRNFHLLMELTLCEKIQTEPSTIGNMELSADEFL